jgi:hypothetical protein
MESRTVELELKTYVISMVRTTVPVLVGGLTGWLTVAGVPMPEEFGASLTGLLTLLLGAVFTIAYYGLVRWLERKHPGIGILLGIAKAPVAYSATPKQDVKQIEANAVVADHVRQARNDRRAAHRLDTTAIPIIATQVHSDGEG